MKTDKNNRFENFPASIEFKRRFPEIWESFSDEQKKHVVYAMNGWRAEESQLPKESSEALVPGYEHLNPRDVTGAGIASSGTELPKEGNCSRCGSKKESVNDELCMYCIHADRSSPKEGEEVKELREAFKKEFGSIHHESLPEYADFLERRLTTLSLPTEEEIEEKLEQYDQCVFTYVDGGDDDGNDYTIDDLNHARKEFAKKILTLLKEKSQ